MTSAQIDDLFARTLARDEDHEDEAAQSAIAALRANGTRDIFERAAAWCIDVDPRKRVCGAEILCQLRRPPLAETSEDNRWLFRGESFEIVAQMLRGEEDPSVLASAINALGHLGDSKALPLVLGFQDHPDSGVRFNLTFALGCFPNDPRSVASLRNLAADRTTEVRDWAVFGLGVLGDADSPEIREILLYSLADESENVREEAAIGLGKRRESRLLPDLLRMLDQPDLKVRVAEAASLLLGLDHDPPEWIADDYKAALAEKFPAARRLNSDWASPR